MTNSNVPIMTPEQRAAALEKARETRARRADLRGKLATGEVKFSELLEISDTAATKMKVSAAVKALSGYGPAKTEKLMAELGIAPDRRIGGLGDRQKAELAEILG